MKKQVYSAVILLSLATPALVVAADNTTEVHGSVEAGVRGVAVNGNEARFNEFRDIDDGVTGSIQLDALKGAYHFQFDADKIGEDDQFFQLKGGEYGNFKYKFIYDEIVHNYGFDAITPYSGLGTSRVTLSADTADITTWTHFDSKVNHKRYGGELEVSLHSPYFVKFGIERREQDGLRPYTVHRPSDAEVPEPISNSTDNFNLQAGYGGESLTASISGSLSSFNNDNKFMATATPDADDNYTIFSQDNDYSKLAANLTWRNLPVSSVFSAAASYANLENSYTAGDINLNATNLNPEWTTLNSRTFDGDIDYTSVSVALSSNPINNLDTKIYYNYLERDNGSSAIYYDATHDNRAELLSYDKNTVGIDVGYKLPVKTKLEAGYEYLKIDRSTPDGSNEYPTNETKDKSAYVQLKNSTLDWLTAKVRYKHLKRDSDELENPTPFYYQDQSSDEWKLGLALYPMDQLDLGLDYTYKNTDYDYAIDTRTDDTRHSLYLDGVWHVIGKATLSGFIGYETVETDANRVTDNTVQTTPLYAQTIDDDFWTYGLVANVPNVVDKLTLNVSWQYQKSDGSVDFDNSLTGTTYENITESDDYTKKLLEAKAIYALSSSLEMTLGYIYEKYEYSDISINNFSYTAVAGDYYGGVYAFPNYEANIGYLAVKYGF